MVKHLIIGGTGTVGSEVVRGLLDKGETVKVLTRSEEKARNLPKGAQAVIGDLRDPATWPTAFADFDHLFLLNGKVITELHEALVAINEAQQMSCKRIVYLSIHEVELGPHIPHFSAKLAAELAIKNSGIPYTILRANNFIQNDLKFQTAMLEYGLYPQPLGDKGLSRIDVRDIGDAAVNALTQAEFENQTFAMVGPKSVTGTETAEIWSQALRQEIRYAGNDLESWGQKAAKVMPDWLIWDMKHMYRLFQNHGLVATATQLQGAQRIIGHAPRSLEAFAAETAQAWGRS